VSLAAQESARRLVAGFRGRRILVVGDVMLDRFIWGDVDRISPEAPVPVVRVRRETAHLGGAANVAENLAQLGAQVSIVGVIGSDAPAEQIRAMLRAAAIGERLVQDGERTTTVKTRVIARAQQVVRVDRESEGVIAGALQEQLTAGILEGLESAQALVLSDYDKGVVGPHLLRAVLPAARRRGVPVVVDPKISHFRHYQPITVLTPNQGEAARAAAMEIRSDEDCLAAARTIMERLDTQAVLVTRGERGMLLLERGGTPRYIPAVAREVYDVTGAGDTVVALLALTLAAGASMLEAAMLANHAGGIVVGKVGTATVTPEEILDRLGDAGGEVS